jgi:hypothetical protein
MAYERPPHKRISTDRCAKVPTENLATPVNDQASACHNGGTWRFTKRRLRQRFKPHSLLPRPAGPFEKEVSSIKGLGFVGAFRTPGHPPRSTSTLFSLAAAGGHGVHRLEGISDNDPVSAR